LGTGSAWAHPIEWTRVYVVAPPGVDFAVQYPELGSDQSGFELPFMRGKAEPRILDVDYPAFAVDNAVGDFGRVWRATYLYSNASQDVLITRLAELSPETLAALKLPDQRAFRQALAYALSIMVALVAWLVAWRYIMPRLLGIVYHWRDLALYQHALGWALLYPLTNGVTLALALVLSPLTAGAALLIGAPLLFVALLGGLSLLFFIRWSSDRLGVSSAKAFQAYAAVALVSNVLYMVFALGYATLFARV
jgi:hypothetical protein